MDRSKIGKFIARQRKAINLTQEELAERLGVTNKSVSKWENGVCLPDASSYQMLCEILGISINELFAGEKLIEVDRNQANEYLIDLLASRIYDADCGIGFDEFRNYLVGISETTVLLSGFESKSEAVEYMMRETDLSYEECSDAFDFYIGLNKRRA